MNTTPAMSRAVVGLMLGLLACVGAGADARRNPVKIGEKPAGLQKMGEDASGGWSTILDLPVHRGEYAAALSGEQEIVSGEYLVWHYPFGWHAVDEVGSRVYLSKGQMLRFREGTPARMVLETEEGVRILVTPPPNLNQDLRRAMKLAPIRLIEQIGKVSAEVIRNRLGSPSSRESGSDGGVVYQYSSGIIAEGWFEYEVECIGAPVAGTSSVRRVVPPTTRRPQTNPLTGTTTINRPAYFERRFYAWDFTLAFDKEGKLISYRDDAVKGERPVRFEPLHGQLGSVPELAPVERGDRKRISR